MEVKSLRILALEVHRALNDLSPGYHKNLFVKQNSGTRRLVLYLFVQKFRIF